MTNNKNAITLNIAIKGYNLVQYLLKLRQLLPHGERIVLSLGITIKKYKSPKLQYFFSLAFNTTKRSINDVVGLNGVK